MGRSDLVLTWEEANGLAPAGYSGAGVTSTSFLQLPLLLVYGDGTVIGFRNAPAAGTPPMLPPLFVRQLDAAGMRELLVTADQDRLLRRRSYRSATAEQTPDAGLTTLTISANGQTYVHRAYGRTIDSSGARRQLNRFIERLTDLDALASPGHVTPAELYRPNSYAVRAQPVDERVGADDGTGEAAGGESTNVVVWPTGAGSLADAQRCLVVRGPEVDRVLAAATSRTRFRDGATVYQATVRVLLPGLSGC
ncbi:hypothetical protein [Pseudofrankia sp. BMG5.36]|uniref:hypothetical protein n=1 Tax=Pseudofrankia sp. BMG5.36 TaxID=1834512 RepID=UPI0008DA93C7|nr:hypothetical protein [Pseudofrankia sp. BMG5.36]OHV64715.1 hypothetical protein BCD48_37210 [Pseudofrankia sp. BMG5.36]